MNFVLLCAFLFVLLLISILLMIRKGSNRPQKGLKLPPGSMGLPFLGETLRMYSENPDSFFINRQKRYGEIFKTHILGCPCVLLSSPEAIKFVLVTQASLFRPTYPPSKERLIGPWALFFHDGGYHAHIRKLVQAALSLDVIRGLVPDIQAITMSALDSMASGKIVNTFHEMKKLTLDLAVLTFFGHSETHYKEMLKKNYLIVDKGYNSFSSNVLGSLYSKSLKARRRLHQIIAEIISKKKEQGSSRHYLLDSLLNFKDQDGQGLTDDQIADNIIGVLFAAQDTTASLSTWILKYIHDDSKLLGDIKAEQKMIYEANDGGKKPLTWAQTRNMTLTNRVIMEGLRLASIISFTFREAVEDIEYKGYLIPKGWKVLPLFRNVHQNPDFFPDPLVFDPSRFEVGPRPNTYLPFGTGVHSCPGNEVAKLEILVLIHCLVNNFRFEVVGMDNGIQYSPFLVPGKGLPAKYWKASDSPGDMNAPDN